MDKALSGELSCPCDRSCLLKNVTSLCTAKAPHIFFGKICCVFAYIRFETEMSSCLAQ